MYQLPTQRNVLRCDTNTPCRPNVGAWVNLTMGLANSFNTVMMFTICHISTNSVLVYLFFSCKTKQKIFKRWYWTIHVYNIKRNTVYESPLFLKCLKGVVFSWIFLLQHCICVMFSVPTCMSHTTTCISKFDNLWIVRSNTFYTTSVALTGPSTLI